MKYIKFNDEVISIPKDSVFWVHERDNSYKYRFTVNLSPLNAFNLLGTRAENSILTYEPYETVEKAYGRLDEILNLLNS